MGARACIGWVAVLLLGLILRLEGAAREPGRVPSADRCGRWVQVDPPAGPLVCLDRVGAAGLRLLGVPAACATDRAWRAGLRPGDAIVTAGPGCRTTRMEPGRLGLLRLPVDLQRAGAAELATLPGVGDRLAARIIAHRARHGPWRDSEALLAVPGIGPRLLARIRVRLLPIDPRTDPQQSL
jgi:competence ComEA-like helix-hairpin-helix protein